MFTKKNIKTAQVGIYILTAIYLLLAIYFAINYNSYTGLVIFGLIAFFYEMVARALKKGNKRWVTFGIILLLINVLDGISTLLNRFVFETGMTNIELTIHLIIFVISLEILPTLFKIRKSQ